MLSSAMLMLVTLCKVWRVCTSEKMFFRWVLNFRYAVKSNSGNQYIFFQIGCIAVSWGPAIQPGALLDPSTGQRVNVKRIVSGGCDNLIKIWK